MRHRRTPRDRQSAQIHHDEGAGAAVALVGPHHELVRLQRSVGNRAVAELLGIGQPKLVVGASNDRYEQEADAIAKTVVARLQRGDARADEHTDARADEHTDARADEHTDARADEHTQPPRGGAALAVPERGVRRVCRVSEVGTEGGELSARTEADITRARSGGVALDHSTRTSMERAFGADFGGVRLHAGRDASQLNERVQARAFTIGNDVFFRDALPDPKTAQGQELLAHELTHTVQQGGARGVGRTIQRLAFQGTDWSRATEAKVSSGGGIGVLIIKDDDGPLIVKAGEAMSTEVAVAAQLLNQSTQDGAGGWKGSAPDARPVTASEAQAIHEKAETLLGNTKREKNILDDLAKGNGVMVFGFAQGSELEGLVGESQTKKGAFGTRSLRKDSVSYALMNDSGLVQTLGRGAAVDLALGNVDRLVGSINLENMMIDLENKQVNFIDNVQMKNETFLRDESEFNMTGRSSFDAWAQAENVHKLAGHDFDGLATVTLDELGNAIFGTNKRGSVGKVPGEDRKTVEAAFKKQRSKLQRWLVKGLSEGLANCTAAMQNPKGLVASVPDEFKEPAATNLIARRLVLQGTASGAAWTAAEKEAARLFAQKKSSRRKALAPPPGGPGNTDDGNEKGTGGGTSTPTPPTTTTWQRATPSNV